MKKIIDLIDNFLNRTTMYRFIVYYLGGIWLLAVLFSFFGLLPYSPMALIVSLGFILSVTWLANQIFAVVFDVPINLESSFITGLILALIITPFGPSPGYSYLLFLTFASLWAIASKFLIAPKKKHIFNPAAFAVFATAFFAGQSASWWVGNAYLAIPVLIGGLMMVRKIRRTDMLISFFIAALLSIIIPGLSNGLNLFSILIKAIFYSPLFFFAFVMLTEPLTTPPKKFGRIIYGALTGLLFSPAFHIGTFYTTPEIALLLGNIFSYIISPKENLILTLREKFMIGRDLYEFVFLGNQKFSFEPGQYLEWTIGHPRPDRSGTRRYFTISSSPTENEIRIGVKGNNISSSFKRALLALKTGDTIAASQLSGDFTLPKNQKKKIVFIAGGIGITPFRSMIRYILDKKEKRDVVLFYPNKTKEEVAYRDIFDAAGSMLGVKTIYTLTDQKIRNSKHWRQGRVTSEMIASEVPDYLERTYFISGPHAMVTAYKEILKNLGISPRRIKTDYFPGFV